MMRVDQGRVMSLACPVTFATFSSRASSDLIKQAIMVVTSSSSQKYVTEERGSLYSADYRLYFAGSDGYISPWHDIPLFADKSKKFYNMIVEIPRWTNAKMEMSTKEAMSPIKQDIKNNVPRFVHNIFPHHGYIWNYGALPQTWEDPAHIDPDTNAKGDNDPIDVIEIGSKVHSRGSVVEVKVLGTLALIDEGETDWKLVTIDISDAKAHLLNTINDVQIHFPGLLKATHEWFRLYKVPAGKPPNDFAFDGQYKDADFAHKVIEDTHKYWKKLITCESPSLNTETNVEGSPHMASQDSWKSIVQSMPQKCDPLDLPLTVNNWHFI